MNTALINQLEIRDKYIEELRKENKRLRENRWAAFNKEELEFILTEASWISPARRKFYNEARAALDGKE